MSALAYRREIDGLRALAIIPVVLFHAGFDWLGGGYLGVDVFFVISGYLITSILLTEKESGNFSLIHFWERRARRIVPALFFMLLVCIPIAWVLLLPKEHWEFKEGIGSTAIFLSNFLLLDQSGYFDTAAERKPLLHTWSLAIEEQFYLLFPLLWLAVWRRGLGFAFLIIGVIVILSLGLAEWLSLKKPAAAFYLLPTRAWELGFGALLAIFSYRRKSALDGSVMTTIAAYSGLGLILASIFLYTNETPSPSLLTLVPVLGTALVIFGANERNAVGRLLGLPIFVGLGLISYSLYLWHQPILAFARIQSFDSLSLVQKFFFLLVAVLIAYSSWRWVERPFRDGSRVKTRMLIVWGAGLGAFYILVGLDGYRTKQLAHKSEQVAQVLNAEPSVMLLGDSHASHLLPGLDKFLPGQVANFARAGCIPFYGVDRYDSRSKPGICPAVMEHALDLFQSDDRFKTIILASMGPVYLTGEAFRGKDLARVKGMRLTLESDPNLKDRWLIYESAMRGTLTRLRGANKKILFVIDIPELGVDPLFCDVTGKKINFFGTEVRIRNPDNQKCNVSRDEYESRAGKYREVVFRVLADYPEVLLFDPLEFLCDEKICRGIVDGHALYRDADHLSAFGSAYIASRIIAAY